MMATLQGEQSQGGSSEIGENTPCDVLINAKGDVMIVLITDVPVDPGAVYFEKENGSMWLYLRDQVTRMGTLPRELVCRVAKVLEALLTVVWEGQVVNARRVPLMFG